MPTRYRFTAQRFDDRLGLYDYNARYYDAAIGRFISADTYVPGQEHMALTVDFHEQIFLLWTRDHPTGQGPFTAQSLNRYTYVQNNPLGFVDPTGHDEAWFDLTPGQAQELTDGLDEFIHLLARIGQDEELLTYVLTFIASAAIPAIGGAKIAAALAAIGVAVSAGIALIIAGLVVGLVVGAIHWDAKSLQHAAQSLGWFREKLQEAVDASGGAGRITIYARSRTFARDEVGISSANYSFQTNDFSLWNDIGGQLINYMKKYADETGTPVFMKFSYYTNYTYAYRGNNNWSWSYTVRGR
jgi:hypothetical protein